MERGPAGSSSVLKAKGFCENGAQAELLWGLGYKVQHTLGGTLGRLPMSVRNSTCSDPVKMVGNAALFGHQEGLQLYKSQEMVPTQRMATMRPRALDVHLHGSRTERLQVREGCSTNTGSRIAESCGMCRFSF